MFRKSSITKIYDALHGISTENIELSEVIEIMAYCVVDGKVDQKFEFECHLYEYLLEKLMNTKGGLHISYLIFGLKHSESLCQIACYKIFIKTIVKNR